MIWFNHKDLVVWSSRWSFLSFDGRWEMEELSKFGRLFRHQKTGWEPGDSSRGRPKKIPWRSLIQPLSWGHVFTIPKKGHFESPGIWYLINFLGLEQLLHHFGWCNLQLGLEQTRKIPSLPKVMSMKILAIFRPPISKEKVEVCQVAVLQNLPKGEINTFAEALPHYKQLQVRRFFCVSVQVGLQIGWEDVKQRLMVWIWSWRTYANLSRIFSMISSMIFHDPLHQNHLKYFGWWLNTKSGANFAARQTDFSVCLHRFCILENLSVSLSQVHNIQTYK